MIKLNPFSRKEKQALCVYDKTNTLKQEKILYNMFINIMLKSNFITTYETNFTTHIYAKNFQNIFNMVTQLF